MRMNMSEATLLEPTAELAKAIASTGVLAATSRDLVDAFGPAFTAARTIVARTADLTVTDATQVTEMKAARAFRLQLVPIRTGADKLRKELKADSISRGRAIENVYKMIETLCATEEARLEECEKFAERAEAKRKADLVAARRQALSPFVPDVTIYPLGDMTEAAWAQLLNGSRVAFEAAAAAAKKAEDDRLAKIEADRLEGIRIREENARLAREKEEAERAAKAERDRAAAELAEAQAKAAREKAEAEAAARKEREAIEARATEERRIAEAKAEKERREAQALLDAEKNAAREAQEKADAEARKQREEAEAKARVERAAADAKLKAEREARETLEREAARVKAEAEAKAAAEEKARRLAAAAPDAEKIKALAAQIRTLGVTLSPDAAEVQAAIDQQINKFAAWLDAQAAKVGGGT